jgi:hypothetical protein
MLSFLLSSLLADDWLSFMDWIKTELLLYVMLRVSLSMKV